MRNSSEIEGLPRWVVVLMNFIDQVGFPIFAFIVITYMFFVTLGRLIDSMDRNTAVLISLKEKIEVTLK